MLKAHQTEDTGLPDELLTAYYAMRSAYAPGVIARLIEEGASVNDFLQPIVYEGALPAAQDYVRAISSHSADLMQAWLALTSVMRLPQKNRRRVNQRRFVAQ